MFLENVKGLQNHNKGQTLLRILKELEYKVFVQVLNAKDFGIPQNRERIYLVCFRNQKINFFFPQSQNVKTNLGSILEEDVNKKYTISDKLWMGHQKRKKTIGSKVMALSIASLITIHHTQVQLVLDTIKMDLKF